MEELCSEFMLDLACLTGELPTANFISCKTCNCCCYCSFICWREFRKSCYLIHALIRLFILLVCIPQWLCAYVSNEGSLNLYMCRKCCVVLPNTQWAYMSALQMCNGYAHKQSEVPQIYTFSENALLFFQMHIGRMFLLYKSWNSGC